MLQADTVVEMDRLTKQFGISQRTIYYDLQQIDDWLEENRLKRTQRIYGKGIYLDPETKRKLQDVTHIDNDWDYRFDQWERIYLIVLHLLVAKANVRTNTLLEWINVSRGSLFRDMKKAAEWLEPKRIRIKNEKHTGYYLDGSREDKQQLLNMIIKDIFSERFSDRMEEKAQQMLSPEALPQEDQLYDLIEREIRRVEAMLEVQYSDEIIRSLVLQLLLAAQQPGSAPAVDIDEEEKEIIRQTKAYQAAREIQRSLQENGLVALAEEDVYYFAMHLLGSRVQRETAKQSKTEEEHQLRMIITKIVNDFQVVGCLVFDERRQLEDNLLAHLKPAYYRMKYDMPIANDYVAEVQRDYPEILHLTRRSITHLESYLGKPVPEEEAAYIAMHFGGWLHRDGVQTNKKYTAVVICENGIAASALLRSQLEALLPELMVEDILSRQEYEAMDRHVDIIFTTIPVPETDTPVILLPPFLTSEEQDAVHARLKEVFADSSPGMFEEEALLDVISQHATIHEREQLADKLRHFLRGDISKVKETTKPMLEELLNEDTIIMEEFAADWQDSIRKASTPLTDNESVNASYIEAMIQNIEELGPYIVIAPDIAIPHARPESGVNRLGMSLLHLQQPVHFSEEAKHQASVVIVLAAIDNETHLKALSQLTELLSEPEAKEKLLNASSKEEIMQLVKTYSTQ
ncbi:BglG family transcription antiterminator [Marinococcus luteus]|uniref:BglG family transcription antiterminator n=1 Tax=Marinococcus luteus TaxID=1122204 RepID=UPI000A54AFA7|nr:BglG family transcription antiterminator [Marinococcus luteus]